MANRAHSKRKQSVIIIVVVTLSVALLTAFLVPSATAAANIFLPKKVTPKLILEKPADEVNIGDQVTFTGRLVRQLDFSPIASAEVFIHEKGLGGNNRILSTGFTDSNGYFKITWSAFQGNENINPMDIDNVADIYAYFAGDLENDSAISLQYRLKAVNKSDIEITSDKPFYYVSSTAVITISLTDSLKNPIDPDDLYVFFDGMPAKIKSIETGIYTAEVPFLKQGDHKISAEAKFNRQPTSVGLTSSEVSTSSENTIHVIRRPVVLSSSIDSLTSNNSSPVLFFGDKIQLNTMLMDVATNTYVNDATLGTNAITATLLRPDNSIEQLILSPIGSSLVGDYVITDSVPTGVWSIQVNFAGNEQMQPASAQPIRFVVDDYRVIATATQEMTANVTVVELSNNVQSLADVYQLALDVQTENGDALQHQLVSSRIPENWTAEYDAATSTVYLETKLLPVGAGKSMQFQLQTESLITSFTWVAKDFEGNIIATGVWNN